MPTAPKPNQPGDRPTLADGRPVLMDRRKFLDGTIPVFWGPGQTFLAEGQAYQEPTDWPEAGALIRVPRVVRFINDGRTVTIPDDAGYTLYIEYLVLIGWSGPYTYGPKADTGTWTVVHDTFDGLDHTGTTYSDRGIMYGTAYGQHIDAYGSDLYHYHADLNFWYSPFQSTRFSVPQSGPHAGVFPDFSADLAIFAGTAPPVDHLDTSWSPPQYIHYDGPRTVGVSAPVPTGQTRKVFRDGHVVYDGDSGNPDISIP